jgi:hypothetical protein
MKEDETSGGYVTDETNKMCTQNFVGKYEDQRQLGNLGLGQDRGR